MNNYDFQKREIIAACLHLEAHGYTIRTYSNASICVSEGLVVTLSPVNYKSITPNDVMVVFLTSDV
jgi:ribulose-5-phosphate 4-epimerase/fuculose-1-phosphate aldolase